MRKYLNRSTVILFLGVLSLDWDHLLLFNGSNWALFPS